MSRSLIQVVNSSAQTVAAGGVLDLGTTIRRYGCNCRLNGNAVELQGEGYYVVDGAVTVAPTAAGNVQVAVYVNGVPLTGVVATEAATAGGAVTLPLVGTIRQGCCCDSSDNVTLVLVSGAGTVSNVSLRIVKT